ncbi:TetR/AcrR family transcriptional regulator [Streptomyces sp. NPDC047017]|uniref:TetR/AcrR family transcriptional regulator n=1 Tax=Streptomyces sp. NPDC047017 TaxID=3155024 RepID=UPI00340E1B6C
MAGTAGARGGRGAGSAKEKTRDLEAGIALLWGEQDQPTRGPKPSLTPRRIAEAAVALADAEGLDAVSMNKVAGEFGVSAMALYRYVPGKAELVDLMVEAVLAERPDLSAVGPGWRPRLKEWARRSWAVYQRHPWLLAATAMRRQVMGPAQLAWLDTALGVLEPTGLPGAERHQVFLLVVGAVRNLAQQAADFDEDRDREWNRLTGELLDRHADRFPSLTRAVAEGAFTTTGTGATPSAGSDTPAGSATPATPVGSATPVDPFDFALDRILDGVHLLIDRAEGV